MSHQRGRVALPKRTKRKAGEHGPVPAGEPEKGSTRALVALSLTITVVCTLPLFLTGALAVQMREELNFGVAALGVAVALYRGAGAVFVAPIGLLADRIGPSASIRMAAAMAAAASLAIALFADRLLVLTAFLMVAGVANGLGQIGANMSLSRGIAEERQGLAFGLKQSALPVASLVGGLAVPVIALTVGWRWAFVGAALAAAAVGIVTPPARDTRLQPSAAAVNRSTRKTPLLVLAVGLFFGMASASTLSAFTVDAAVSAGIGPASAGILLAVGSICAVAVRLLVGAAADRRGHGHLPVVARLIAAGAVGYLLLALGTRWSIAIGTIVAFGLGWGFNGLFWFAIVRLNRATPGRVTGMVMPGGMFGGLMGPLVFGWLAELRGYPTGWLVAAAWALVGSIIMVVGRRLLLADLADPRLVP